MYITLYRIVLRLFSFCSLPSQTLNATFLACFDEVNDDLRKREAVRMYWNPFPHPLMFSYHNEFLQRYSFITVTNAGTHDVNGTYYPIGLLNYSMVWENNQHMYLSREWIDGAIGWIFGNMQVCYYGQPTPNAFPPTSSWRVYSGTAPAPTLECHFGGDSATSYQLKSELLVSQPSIRSGRSLDPCFMYHCEICVM